MKTLDVKYLQESIQQTKLDIESMQEEIEAIQSAVRDFYSLEGAFEGQAGDAIRHFYQDTHEPFLIFFQQSLSDYQAALDKISDAVFSYESNPKGYVSQDYLASDVPQGLQRAGNEAQQLTTEAQAIINSISDLVSIPAFDESGVMDAVRTGKQQADESIQGLVELDRQGVAHLKSTQTDLDKMDAFLSDMKSTFSSKQSLTSYHSKMLHQVTGSDEILGELTDIAKEKNSILIGLNPDSQAVLNKLYLDHKLGNTNKKVLRLLMNELKKGEFSEISNQKLVEIGKAQQDFERENPSKTSAFWTTIAHHGPDFVLDIVKDEFTDNIISGVATGVRDAAKYTTTLFNDLSGAAVLSPAGINLGVATEYVPAEPLKNVLRPFVNNLPEQAPSIIGPVIDFTGQMIQGEQVHHAAIKTVAHIGTMAIGMAAGTFIVSTISLPFLTAAVGTAAGVVIGTGISRGFDVIYDNYLSNSIDDAKDALLNIEKNVSKKVGNAFKGLSSNLNTALN